MANNQGGNNSRNYQQRSGGYQQVHLHFHAAPLLRRRFVAGMTGEAAARV
jgi:hypothetical protein